MLTPSLQLHANYVPDAVIPTPVAPVQPLTMNAITATPLGTLQPCAGDPTPTDIQLIPLTRGGSTKADNTCPSTTNVQAGHIAEEGSHLEATPEIEETLTPVTAHLRSAPLEDHPDMEDAVPHCIGTR